MQSRFLGVVVGLPLVIVGLRGVCDAQAYQKKDSWRQTLVANLCSGPRQAIVGALKDFPDDRQMLETVADWLVQDKADADGRFDPEAIGRVLDEMALQRDRRKGAAPASVHENRGGPRHENRDGLRGRYQALTAARTSADDPQWAELYLAACELRREARLQPHREKLGRIIFTKHYDMGGSHYAYTEGQSDAQAERHFQPGSALCILEMDGLWGKVRTLVDDPTGVIRDPDVSYDGRRVLFAWKKSLNEDDYHLYEITPEDGRVRQLTEGLGFADYEGAYLPSGDLVFNSTRCVQIVDCWWTEVSNLFTCDKDGRYLRQLSFDQVHTNFPTVTHDGRVIYTRWDYNDRGQIYPQGLFQMNQDGTAQTALYGNNSWFPTTILHARSIPGTGKIICIFTGHHSRQKGWLGVLDPSKGREENEGAQLIAPVRETPAVHVDAYGQSGDQFQYPYPLSETEFLVTFRLEKQPRFGIYFMTAEGKRELLVSDPKISCNQPVPLLARPVPPVQPSQVDYRKTTGTVYLQDVYEGPGLAGIPRGAIKALRVVALEFRAAGIGSNSNGGPAGGAMISTPVSIQGAWDVKKVLGTAQVNEDGSACFTVPARTPLYFQALDEKGQMVQTMRSWLTLQPGESVSCVGCHENKNGAPPVARVTQAMLAGPQSPEPFYGPPRGFSFIREIQPILDTHCVRCHHLDEAPKFAASAGSAACFDCQKTPIVVPCRDVAWRYTFEKPNSEWKEPNFDDAKWSYGLGGFGTKGTPGAAVGTLWKTPEIWLRRTFELPKDIRLGVPALLVHHDEDVEVYLNGAKALVASGFTKNYGVMPMNPAAASALKPGQNTMAVHCVQTSGGQYIDVGIVETRPESTGPAIATPANPKPDVPAGVKPMFSLKGTQKLDERSQRLWSDSYKALANRYVCNWINVQSAPPMLPPYSAGASQSRLIQMLQEGHNGVRLTRSELERFVVWIDLLVPYVGDYTEAMHEGKIGRYQHFVQKRARWHAIEARNIDELMRARQEAE